MAVFRVEKTKDFTIMSNHHLRNPNLSLKAKGLLSLMLSLPEDWDYTTKGLAQICKEGVDSIGTALKELERYGYLTRRRLRCENGQLGDIEYTIHETPAEVSGESGSPNPLAPDPAEAEKAIEYVIDRLKLAEKLEARCCVNIIGSASTENWYAPAEENFTDEFHRAAVETYRKIIDAVEPVHTKLAFEVMPFSFLDCTKEYLEFLKELNREEAAVHLDLINLIHDPRTLYEQRKLFAEAVQYLGNRCVSAHLKDIIIDKKPFNTNMVEVLPGTGEADLHYMAQCLALIPGDLPVMLEHLPDEEAYDRATHNFTRIAKEAGVNLKGGF